MQPLKAIFSALLIQSLSFSFAYGADAGKPCKQNMTRVITFDHHKAGTKPPSGLGFLSWTGWTIQTYNSTGAEPASPPHSVGTVAGMAELALAPKTPFDAVTLNSFYYSYTSLCVVPSLLIYSNDSVYDVGFIGYAYGFMALKVLPEGSTGYRFVFTVGGVGPVLPTPTFLLDNVNVTGVYFCG